MEGYEGEPCHGAPCQWHQSISRDAEMKRPRGFLLLSANVLRFLIVDGVPNVRTCITPLKRIIEVQRGKGRNALSLAKVI